MKAKKQKLDDAKLRMHTRGFPIWIRDGKLIEPEAQVVEFLSHMFAYVESSGERPLQATMEIKILTGKK